MSGGAATVDGCAPHDWIVFVPDPAERPEVGVQQCTRCLVEVDRLHPIFVEPPALFLDDQDVVNDVFGPIAAGLARREHPAGRGRLTPTFMEPPS